MSNSIIEKNTVPSNRIAAENSAPIHFPWLTEARFFAALAVVICHVSQFRHWDGIGPHSSTWMGSIGSHGVRVFFVLSGFLITHLLISERLRTGTIDIGKFYLRRALRIWPLYYALLVVAFVVPAWMVVLKSGTQIEVLCDFRYHDLGSKVALFGLMLPNVAALLFPPLVGAAQTWSIGVEEQFYLFWPVLVKKFGGHPLRALLGVVAIKFLAVTAVAYLLSSTLIAEAAKPSLQVFAVFLNFLEIEAMAVGGIAACLLMRHPQLLRTLTRNSVVRLALILVIPYLFTHHFVQHYQLLLCDLIYATMLICLTLSNLQLPRPIAEPLAYFGKISYGIYMLHPLVILFTTKILFSLNLHMTNTLVLILLYSVSIGLTVVSAAVCYELFEKRFLVYKKKFAVIESAT